MDNMLAAYVNEYGRELANELTGNNIVEGEVIEDDADILGDESSEGGDEEVGSNETSETTGSTSEDGVGNDSQVEEQVTDTVSEDSDEDE